ncbi:hypothetical protein AB0K15_36625 [Amycolatopsis sp. NPDC049253]|uniref:hypothetical protein n=1 Tax=Amycolatopsis sp. NPDC049253 TaxID=3155274 RepID=UPI003424D3A7
MPSGSKPPCRSACSPANAPASAWLGDVGIYDVRGTTQVVRRTSRTGNVELLKICLIERGGALVEQGRRRGALGGSPTSRGFRGRSGRSTG